MKLKTFIMTIALLAGFAVLIFLIIKQSYLFAVITFVLIGILIYLLMESVSGKQMLDIDVIVKAYTQLLSQKFNYDLEKNATVLYTEEMRDSYLIVLKDMMDDGEVRFWPFECNKFQLKFGRGTGTFKVDIAEIKHWLISASKSNINSLILDVMEQQLNNQQRQSIIDDYERSRRRGVINGGQERTQEN